MATRIAANRDSRYLRSRKLSFLAMLALYRYFSYCWGPTLPKDPSVLKIVRRANSLRRGKNATAITKRYGECSEVLVFVGKRRRKTVRIVKNYGGSKILRIRVPYYFWYGRVLWAGWYILYFFVKVLTYSGFRGVLGLCTRPAGL